MAATSLADAFTATKAPFEAANPGMTVTFSFGPSAAMRTAAEAGGADVFASDDLNNVRSVVTDRLAAGPAPAFATDPIVLVVPAANPGGVSSSADLARPGVRIAGAAPNTALTANAAQVISRLSALPGYPPNFSTAVAGNTAASTDDAGAVLAKLEAGQADAALVFASDAHASPKIQVVALPDGAKVSRTLGVVILAAAGDAAAASAFVLWLTTRDGQATLAQFGYEPVGAG
jgi:molybdate transport system substrate-binding protein